MAFLRKNRVFFNVAACLIAWSVWGASDIGSLPVPYYDRIGDPNPFNHAPQGINTLLCSYPNYDVLSAVIDSSSNHPLDD